MGSEGFPYCPFKALQPIRKAGDIWQNIGKNKSMYGFGEIQPSIIGSLQ